jgi:hypothetical protein
MTAIPRLRPNPKLLAAVRACGRPGWQIALAAGFVHVAKFSWMLHARSVPATPLNRERYQKIAAAIDFPVEHLFLDGSGR